MWSNMKTLTAAMVLLGAAGMYAQDAPIPAGAVNINLPDNSPLALKSFTMADSRATARGAALALDLHMSATLRNNGANRIHGVTLRVVAQEVTLGGKGSVTYPRSDRGAALALGLHMSATLRNNGANRIHGVTLRVVAQEVTLGGKGSVTYPSLNVGPGETFQVRIDMQLMRPSQVTGAPLVQVDLDGVLFQDLSFFGPDRLNSRRTMTACEMEAQRDREHFKRVLAQAGRAGLQREMLESMARQSEISQLAVSVKRSGRAVTSAATASEHDAEFAFL